MAFNRAATLTDLANRYATLLAAAGLATTDTAAGLGPVLDRTDAIAAEQPDLSDATLALVARYVALDLLTDRLAGKMDVSTGGDSYKLNQLYTNAKALRDSLGATVGWLALGELAGAPAGQIVTVTAPYLAGHATGDEFGAGRW